MSEAQSNRVGIEFQTNMDTDKQCELAAGHHVSPRDTSKLKIMKMIRRLFLVALQIEMSVLEYCIAAEDKATAHMQSSPSNLDRRI
jgi:hypothetical protein